MAGQSHKGDGLGAYPRECAVCGQRVKITGTVPLVFEWTPADGRRSWHADCKYNRAKETT